MKYFKFLYIFILFSFISITGNAQLEYIQKKASFKINGESIQEVKYYLVLKKNLYSIPYHNGIICFPDTLSSKRVTLMVSYNKHSFFVTNFNYKEAYYLNTYFDHRFFNNGVNKKFGGYSKLKYLFKKRYLIDDGSGYVTITPWADIRKYNIPEEMGSGPITLENDDIGS